MKTLRLSWLSILVVAAVSHASEEDFVHWRSITLDCGTVEKAGRVSLVAGADDTGFQRFEITAFGRTHRLSEADLKRLRGFPLSSLRVTHEAGYPETGGHTVCFRFRKVYYDAEKKLRQEEMTVSVDETRKVRLSGPRGLEKPSDQGAAVNRRDDARIACIGSRDAAYAGGC